MKKWILLVVLLFPVLQSGAQSYFYVNQATGNDSNTGTTEWTAWKTIQKACNTVSPNSVVLIKGGTYYENISMNVSGTESNPIVLTNYGDDTVIIDGTGTSGFTLLKIKNKDYITIANLILQNVTGYEAKGIEIYTTENESSAGLRFTNIKIRNIKWTANTTALPTPTDNAQAFVALGANGGITDLVIDGCEVSNNVLGYSEALTLSGNIDGFTIKNCSVHDNTNIGIGLAGNYGVSTIPALDKVRGGLVQNNICYRNISPISQSAGIYVDGGQDIVIERNSCYENGLGIEVGCEKNGTTSDITVKNNLIFNNRNNGLHVGGYTLASNGQVLNSTFRNNSFFKNNALNAGFAEIDITKASNCIFEDNLLHTNNQNILIIAENIAPQANNLVNYNCWYTPSGNPGNIVVYWGLETYTTLESYIDETGHDENSVFGNPLLQSPALPLPDFDLLASSTCINSGNPELAVPEGETDFFGNPRVSGNLVDIGAFEFTNNLQVGGNEALKALVRVFPNPFTEETTLVFPATIADATIFIYDISGRKRQEIRHVHGMQATIRRESLATGFYFYKVMQGTAIIANGKLVIN